MKKTNLIFGLLLFSAFSLVGCNNHTHTLVHHDAVGATCTEAGTVEYWECTECTKLYSDELGTVEITSIVGDSALGHDMTHYAAVTPTCTVDGNVEYWHCNRCNLNFADANGNSVLNNVVVAKTGHSLSKHNRQEPSCTEAGNVEYYECSKCHVKYADSAAKTVLTDVVLPALGHDMSHVDAVAPNCTDTGICEHYHCSRCNKDFSDTQGTTVLNSVIVDAEGHNLTHVPAKDASCLEDGNIEYWACSKCQKKYSDAEAKNLITGDVTLVKLGHSLSKVDAVAATCEEGGVVEHYHCSRCLNNYEDEAATTLLAKVTTDKLGHAVVKHEAKDPTKTEAGLSTTYYTCSREADKYFSDEECTDDIAASVVEGYAIKSFDDLDAMLNGATGANAYDDAAITEAYNYFNTKYSTTAQAAYGNGAVLTAKTKYDALYTGAEFDVNTVKQNFWGPYNKIKNGTEGQGGNVEFNGSPVDTPYGPAFTFKVKNDLGETDWEGGRWSSSFALKEGTYANVFYLYAPVATKVGLIGWDANPQVTKDCVAGWNKIIVPNEKLSYAHTSNQFRIAVYGAKANGTAYKFTSVWGMTKTQYANEMIADANLSTVLLDNNYSYTTIKDFVDTLTDAQKAYVNNWSSIDATWNGVYTNLFTTPFTVGAEYYQVTGKGLIGQTDVKGDTYFKPAKVKATEKGLALPFSVQQAYDGWAGFRIGFNKDTTAYAAVFYIYSPVANVLGLIPWADSPVATFDLAVGWNKIVIDNALLTTLKGWSGQFRFVLRDVAVTTSQYLLTQVYGISQKQFVLETIDTLKSGYIYSQINNAYKALAAYNGLSADDKAAIDPTPITTITNKYYNYLKAKIYGAGDGTRTWERLTNTEVGLAYKIGVVDAIGDSVTTFLRINISDAQSGDLDTANVVNSDTMIFFTKGLTFTDGEDDLMVMKDTGGSNVKVGKMTHKNLDNGWVMHTLTGGRAKNLADYINAFESGSYYLRLCTKNIAAGTTIYVSSFYGVKA